MSIHQVEKVLPVSRTNTPSEARPFDTSGTSAQEVRLSRSSSWVLPLLMLCVSCQGQPGSSAGPSGSPDTQKTSAATLNTYTIEVTGDNVTYTLSFFTDSNEPTETQLVVGLTTIQPGQTITYTVSGYASELNSGFSRVGGTDVANGGNWLVVKVFKNGTQVRHSQLSDAGTYDGWPEW